MQSGTAAIFSTQDLTTTSQCINARTSEYEIHIKPSINPNHVNANGEQTEPERIFRFYYSEANSLGHGGFTGGTTPNAPGGVYIIAMQKKPTYATFKDCSTRYIIKIADLDTKDYRTLMQHETAITKQATHRRKDKKTGEIRHVRRKAWFIYFNFKTPTGMMLLPAMIQPREKGIELFDFLEMHDTEAHPLTLASKLQLTLNIISAVETLHHAGIIHGDLKPENFIRNEETGDIEAIDFGLSHIKGEPAPNVLNPAERMPVNLSPEEVSNQETDEKSDSHTMTKVTLAGIWNLISREEKAWLDSDPNAVPMTPRLVSTLRLYASADTVFTLYAQKNDSPRLTNAIKEILMQACKADKSKRLSLQEVKERFMTCPTLQQAILNESSTSSCSMK